MSPLSHRFVMHFGEMGSRWGINRTVGQIYALLFVTERPLHADEIAEQLAFSRSNVSMGLKELDGWRLLRRSYLPGDRREYFAAPDDVWLIFRTLAEERKKREIDPTLTLLRDALLEPSNDPSDGRAQQRMGEMLAMIEMLTGWFEDMRKLDQATLTKLMKLGTGVVRLIEMKDKLVGVRGEQSANDQVPPSPLPGA
ncbi:MAG: GbsR/MarR family transcriptional regulator [Stagnimonas sp.]|nr:GbsR/MarR family transcriptional regulator [Stagnimonas sp.]